MSSYSSEDHSHRETIRVLLYQFKHLPDIVVVTTLALVVGIGGGFGAILTEWLVEVVHKIFFEEKLWGLLEGLGIYHLMIIMFYYDFLHLYLFHAYYHQLLYAYYLDVYDFVG